ncbi:MAG TPA: hypothetical protein VFV41_23625 [Streptosporangiaceae bacterium]|nr:hypothetical protein [Streptosporangiaceae bacterium]
MLRGGPRTGPRAAALVAGGAAAAVLAAALGGCGSGGPAAGPAPGRVFLTRQQVSLGEVQQAVTALYRARPGIGSFTVQDVQYSARSWRPILRECTSGTGAGGGAAAGAAAQTAESGQLIACAPLIFFLYSYGRIRGVPAAAAAAGKLYWYAVTHISGPSSARTSLNELLRSWKLPVPALTPAEASKAAEASVVAAASNAIVAAKTVHIVITGRKPGSTAVAERIVADIGATAGTETITSGVATARIRVTRSMAYFAGNPAGLTTFIGLPKAAASRAGSRWVAIRKGTAEYSDLAAEDTIAALPASLLPGTSDAARIRTATMSGRKVYILDWQTTASDSGSPIAERLILTAGSTPLPVRETTTANGNSQTVTLGRWGQSLTVAAPTAAIPYSRVTG